MARKKKKNFERENIDRWLVSYADFITLLFATFVILYAVTQVDTTDFVKLEESLRNAFSIFDGQQSSMDDRFSIFDQQAQGNSFIPSLMPEYISPKYEEESFKEIEESIKKLTEAGELDGVTTKIIDDGLLITFDDKYLFAPASAELSSSAKKLLDKVGLLICKKFILHAMKIEGHTDSNPISSFRYPSNWELSAARASSVVRYMISRFNFSPSLFSAVGYADTRPRETAISPKDPANRRVEILILKNKYNREFNAGNNNTMQLSKIQQETLQKQRQKVIAEVEEDSISPAARKLLEENKGRIKKRRTKKLSESNMKLYINLDNERMSPNMPSEEKRVIKLDAIIPEDEDFGL